jgi:hypothetical protein
MNISITPEQEAIFAIEAASRNKALAQDETPHTTESIALLLIAKSAEGYAVTHAASYARDLYERIQAADPAVQKAIFTAAEKALK